MVKCLQYRRKSILKDMLDQIQWRQCDLILYTKGHTLGALLQDLDAYAASGPSNINILGLTQHLRRLLALDIELQTWYRQFLQDSPSPVYWPTTPEGQDPGAFSFASLQLAHLVLDYWALRLILSATVTMICAQIPIGSPPVRHENGSQSPATSAHSGSDEFPEQARDIANFIQQVKAEHNGARQMELATNIMESLPFCIDAKHGISSSQKCIFGAKVAFYLLQRRPPAKFAEYEALYNALSVNKGLSFAKNVEQTLQRWEGTV
jgi:hypothetical protein